MKFSALFVALIALTSSLFAADAPSQEKVAQLIKAIKSLNYENGEISLAGGKAKLKLTNDYRYLNPTESRKVIVDIWRNPPGAGSNTQGMIVPASWQLEGLPTWGAVLKWKEEGYIKDEEYDSTDFNKMLVELKAQSKEASAERVRQGYGKLEITGWAEPPHYDKTTHKLYWAKALDNGSEVQSLNYDIRVLGRAGVLEVAVVDDVSNLQEIHQQTPALLSMIDFTEGNRYADYKSGDKVAAYGIAGLVAGGVLAKTGFFKMLPLLLLKFWKLVLVGIAGIGWCISKIFGGRKANTAS